MLRRYTDPEADLAPLSRTYFDYTLDRVLDGPRVRLDDVTQGAHPRHPQRGDN